MDVTNVWGKTRDLVIVRLGNSTLYDVVRKAADEQGGRNLKPDPRPEVGGFYRSDHFEFAEQGIPSLDIDPGQYYIGKPADFGRQKDEEYNANDYHRVSHEIKPGWDLSGESQDIQLLFRVGLLVADGDRFPDEFKARRDLMLSKRP